MRGKLITGRFFVERILPGTELQLARIRLGSANVMELPAESF
jgi:acyl-CoA dehydrogenase